MCKTCQNYGLKNLGNEIVRDSPMVNFVSQTMNKHIKMRLWSESEFHPGVAALGSLATGNTN